MKQATLKIGHLTLRLTRADCGSVTWGLFPCAVQDGAKAIATGFADGHMPRELADAGRAVDAFMFGEQGGDA